MNSVERAVRFAINIRMEIRTILEADDRSQICQTVLRSLPQWFGIEAAVRQYIEAVKEMDALAAYDSRGILVGFLALKFHFGVNAEIYVLGVMPHAHRSGVGRKLVESACGMARQRAAKFLSVKTLSPKRENDEYRKTRLFYDAVGFVCFEEFENLWGADNPCLEMILPL